MKTCGKMGKYFLGGKFLPTVFVNQKIRYNFCVSVVVKRVMEVSVQNRVDPDLVVTFLVVVDRVFGNMSHVYFIFFHPEVNISCSVDREAFYVVFFIYTRVPIHVS